MLSLSQRMHAPALTPLRPHVQELEVLYAHVKHGQRTGQRLQTMWDKLCALAGGPDALSTAVSRTEFERACRSKFAPGLDFLKAMCLRPYIALVLPGQRGDIKYDPSKTDLILGPAFAAALIRAIVAFAKKAHLPPPRPPAHATAAKRQRNAAAPQDHDEDEGEAAEEEEAGSSADPRRSARGNALGKPGALFAARFKQVGAAPRVGLAKSARPQPRIGPEAWTAAVDVYDRKHSQQIKGLKTADSPPAAAKVFKRLRAEMSALARTSKQLQGEAAPH